MAKTFERKNIDRFKGSLGVYLYLFHIDQRSLDPPNFINQN